MSDLASEEGINEGLPFYSFGCPGCRTVYNRFLLSDHGTLFEVPIPSMPYAVLEEIDKEYCEKCEQQERTLETLMGGKSLL